MDIKTTDRTLFCLETTYPHMSFSEFRVWIDDWKQLHLTVKVKSNKHIGSDTVNRIVHTIIQEAKAFGDYVKDDYTFASRYTGKLQNEAVITVSIETH
jgi:hypothetical protein